jgi:3-hydroxy-3-methylglutaryl CoA synthase
MMFSYGSGLAASMFSLRFSLSSDSQREELKKMIEVCQRNKERLKERVCKTPLDYKNAIQRRSNQIDTVGKHKPLATTDALFPNTYYIREIDSECRRFYDLFSA